tara:strand:- start:4292 stop:4492 length:201 start_codon:yes stop_codon:yes gene_type:complete
MDPRLDKVIKYFREEMMAANAVGQSGGFSSSADAKGPVAGYDKPMKKKPQKRYASGGVGSRKRWMK